MRETIPAQVVIDPLICHCYTYQLHMYPCAQKCSVTPAHSHTKGKTGTAVQVDNNRDKERGNEQRCISHDLSLARETKVVL